MTRRLVAIALAVAVSGLAGCGKPPEQKAAEEQAKAVKEGAKEAQKGADQMTQGLQQMAQGLQQMAQSAQGGGQTAAPVDASKLEAMLPAVGGWTRSEPETHQLTMPFAMSNAEATYTKGDARINVTMTDSAFNQLALAPLMMITAAGYSEKTSHGYKKASVVNGNPGYEEWNSTDKDGNIGVIVGKRFLIEAKGSGLDSIDTLKDFVGKIDLGKLAGLK